jgi:hypothetical protein
LDEGHQYNSVNPLEDFSWDTEKKYSFHSLGGVMEECKSKIQRCSVYDPAKIFFTSKFSHVLFCNPTHKTEGGAANRWGGRLIVNHMDESL